MSDSTALNGLALFDEDNLPIFEQDSYEEHTSAWIMVDESIEGHRWALGAVAASLTKRYGDDIVGNFASDVKSSKARIYQYAKTYQVFQKCTRVHFLSFRHHTIAARAEDPERIIELADRYELSTRELDTLAHSGELPERHRAIETPDENGEEPRIEIEPVARDPKVLSRYELEEIAAQSEKARVKKETSARDKERTKRQLREQAEEIAANPFEFPMGKFRVIEADPPWALNSHERKSQHYQYPTQELEEIKAMGDKVIEAADDDAHLYLWAINPMLEEAFEVVRAWGFEFKTLITWAKPSFGTGHYFRGQTEHVLFAVRGSLPTLDDGTANLLQAPKGAHSEKPEAFYDLVEGASPGPYLRLYARSQRDSWFSWGDQAAQSQDGESEAS